MAEISRQHLDDLEPAFWFEEVVLDGETVRAEDSIGRLGRRLLGHVGVGCEVAIHDAEDVPVRERLAQLSDGRSDLHPTVLREERDLSRAVAEPLSEEPAILLKGLPFDDHESRPCRTSKP